MTEPATQSRESRHLLRAIALSLASALMTSAVLSLASNWTLVGSVLAALVIVLAVLAPFWAWVGLGMTVGLLILPGKLRPGSPAHTYMTTTLTALLCGGCLFSGAHDLVLAGVLRLLRFKSDLVGYYLVWLQFLYFFLAILASSAFALAGCALRFLWLACRRRATCRQGLP